MKAALASAPLQAEIGDRTSHSRIGLKGPNAAAWLQQQGLIVPALPNSWRALPNDADGVVARLGYSEFFLEQAPPSELLARLSQALLDPIEGVYPVLREDRAIVLSGPDAQAVLAQMCNVDFKSLAPSERGVVMTMMIGIAVLVIARGGQSVGATEFQIWCDPSYGDYLWTSLQMVIRGV